MSLQYSTISTLKDAVYKLGASNARRLMGVQEISEESNVKVLSIYKNRNK